MAAIDIIFDSVATSIDFFTLEYLTNQGLLLQVRFWSPPSYLLTFGWFSASYFNADWDLMIDARQRSEQLITFYCCFSGMGKNLIHLRDDPAWVIVNSGLMIY